MVGPAPKDGHLNQSRFHQTKLFAIKNWLYDVLGVTGIVSFQLSTAFA